MRTRLSQAVIGAAAAFLTHGATAEYQYIIRDNSVNESYPAYSDAGTVVTGQNSTPFVTVLDFESRYRMSEISNSIGIDPTLCRGYLLFLK